MRKILDWLKKFNTPLCYGLICIVFGIAFIVLPYLAPAALDVLLIVAGAALIFVGILTVSELDTPDRSPRYYLSVAKTVSLIALGIFVITARSALASRLCLFFGVCILLRAIPTLVKLVSKPATADTAWWIRLIFSIVEIMLGAWLVLYPKWPLLLTGIMLLLVAAELIAKHKKAAGSTASTSDTIFDPDFEDKS